MGDRPEVELFFDVVCPYAWIAAERLMRMEAAGELVIRWRPMLLGGVLRAVGQADRPMDAMAPAKVAHIQADLDRQASALGLSIRYPPDHPRRTVNAMRALVAVAPDRRPDLARVLWRAYWTEGAQIAHQDVLERLIAPFGLTWDDVEGARDGLFASTTEAVDRGVFGAPGMFAGGRLFWGSDRVIAVRHALGLPLPPLEPTGPLEVFHDFSSPYSYLGTVPLLGRPDVTLRPMLLGALFQTLGTPVVPIASFGEARRAWTLRDVEQQAEMRGLPFRFSPVFPLRSVLPLRVALQEPAATGPIYAATWADGLDTGHPDVLREVLDSAGLAGVDLVAGADDPAVKARLRENTERAVSVGVPGAPSYLHALGLFWGQDRLPLIAELEGLQA
ncbi:MAG: DsbA family protein [Alphaproteobacteria bacterium]|nr:DsbA family protein [Alphaproteobacteria bacterium]